GRWFVYGGNWVWWPGPVAVYPAYYPIWAPAYVSFFGWGGGGWGFGVGFGFGGGFGRVGWLPIGPCDRFHPWWGRGGGRVNVVNVTNIHNTNINRGGWDALHGNTGHQFSNLNEAGRDQRVRSGISAMDGNKFGREAVPGHQSGVSAASFRQASMMTGKLPVTPSRESFNSTNRAAGASSIKTAQTSSRRFFSPAASRNSTSSTAANRGGMPAGNSTARNNSVQRQFTPPQRSTVGGNSTGQASQPLARTNTSQRQFTPPAARQNSAAQQRAQNYQPNTSGRGNTAAPNAQAGRNGWQHFSPPPSRNSQPTGPSQPSRTFQPPASASRGGNTQAYNRPPLNMNRPIVQPRGGYPNASRGGYPSVSRGPSGPAGGYRSAPPSPAQRSVPRPSAPPASAAPRGNSSGGSHGSSGGASHGNSGGGGGSSHSSGRSR
ncbi:MAG TPA: hypothetical protein VEX69_06255, partial [Candidatus Limnocylindria bacterium]|nr:hypothetical protein [Candidatus Limnocylindria bacterium]